MVSIKVPDVDTIQIFLNAWGRSCNKWYVVVANIDIATSELVQVNFPAAGGSDPE